MSRTARAARTAAILGLVLLVAGSALALPEKAQTVSGSVSKLDAAARTVVVSVNGQDTRFVWTAETKINGVLAPGARVTIRYTPASDGQNLAHQISVARS